MSIWAPDPDADYPGDPLVIEVTEWRKAVNDMTEMDRAATETDVRRADGLSGDEGDVQ